MLDLLLQQVRELASDAEAQLLKHPHRVLMTDTGNFGHLLAFGRQLQKDQAPIDFFATSLPTMLLFDDDLQFRQETTALFLQAQAYLGLGQTARGRTLLRTVLERDPNHTLAADLPGGKP